MTTILRELPFTLFIAALAALLMLGIIRHAPTETEVLPDVPGATTARRGVVWFEGR